LIEGGGADSRRGSAPGGLAGIDFAGTERHAAPPFVGPMIAPGAAHGKRLISALNAAETRKTTICRSRSR
jgi:hypothetical protein